jgi:pyridoxamine 5'-phosphate oxidase family protein
VSFTEEEITYLRSQSLARLATVSADGQPDVVPVALEFDGTYLWVGGGDGSVTRTRKFRNVRAGSHEVAVVVDDMVSFDPFIVRGIRIYGRAEQPFERVGMIGPGTYLRITPTRSWSWNLAGEPIGEAWYESRRADHRPPRV